MKKCLLCRTKTASNVSLMQFPRDESTFAKWVHFCNVEMSEINMNSRLCSLHFTTGCFKSQPRDGKRCALKTGAIPTVYRRSALKVVNDKEVKEDEHVGAHSERHCDKYKRLGRLPCRISCFICGSIESEYTISCYRFPKDKEKRNEWVQALGIEESELKASSRLCCRHFREGNKNNTPVRNLICPTLINVDENLSFSYQGVPFEHAQLPVRIEQHPSGIDGDSCESVQEVVFQILEPTNSNEAGMSSVPIQDVHDDYELDDPLPSDSEDLESTSAEENAPETLQNLELFDSCIIVSTRQTSKRTFHEERQKIFIQDFSTPDLETPGRKWETQVARSQLEKYKSQRNQLYLENRRVKTKLNKLHQALRGLKQRGLLSDTATETLKALMA